MDRPAGSDLVPSSLHWDAWIEPAPSRPYKADWPDKPANGSRRRRGSLYQPFVWRGWQDFGAGALRVGKKLEWDGPNMLARNAPEAAQFIRRKYRQGWEL